MADRNQIMQALRNADKAGDTQAATRLAQMWRDAGEAPQQTVIATTADGGRIMDMGNGQRAYASAGYSTTDPAKIDELMQGATPAEITQRDFDQERIAQAPVSARAASVAQGLPFVGSYVDEAFGEGRGDNIRQLQGAMRRENPIESGVLNLAGGVIGAAPLAVAAAPAVAAAAPSSTLGLAASGLAAGATTGGLEGAIYGYGEGQTDSERAQKSGEGALTGAVVGGVLGGAAPYAARGIKNIIQRLKASDVKVIARELDVTPEAAGIIRDTLNNGTDQEAMDALRRAGPNAMLADAGRASSDLLDAAAQSGGNASQITQQAMRDRTQAASGQITRALDKTLGAPQGERELIDAVRTGSAPARSAAYDAAYARPINYASTEGRRLESLMPRIPAAAWRRASQLMSLDGDQSLQKLFRIADDGSVSVQSMPDVRQMDYITRALNDVAAEADGAGKLGGTTDLGRSTGNLSRTIRQTMRQAVPEYGTALDTAADAISERNAIETGYTLLRAGTRREDVSRAIGSASKAEKAAAKQGVRAYLDDTMGNVARTISGPDTTTREGIKALRDMSSRSNQTKLRVLLGQDAADELLAEVDRAATAFELRAAIAENSKTARRQSIQSGVDAVADGGVVRTLASGEPINATKLFVQALTGETAEAVELRRMGLYEDIAKALTQTRGAKAQAALSRINSAMNGQPMSEASARMVANTLTSGGVLLGGHEAQMRLGQQ